jgi:Uma2 family endonuclease
MGIKLKKQSDYTQEEYFVLLEEAETKLEYHDGEILEAVAGGTATHNKIKADTFLSLGQTSGDFQPFDSDMAISIPEYNRYVYPDISFVCGADEYTDEKRIFLKNPTLIIEVLSPTTRQLDRGEKFLWYRSLPSFREYVLISSEARSVESWYKESEGLWRIQSANQLNQRIKLFSLDRELVLSDIYRRVKSLL